MRLGIDSGGTFTDVVADDGRISKVASTANDPGLAVARARRALAGDEAVAVLAHGTTVATNALLERRGARVALVATKGFGDVIEIARQARPSLYDPFIDRPEPLVARPLRFDVSGRLDGRGRELEPFDGRVPTIPDTVDAIAICLLHADLDPRHEQAVADVLRTRYATHIVCSHEVSPEFREYERMVTTVVEAFLEPVCTPYLMHVSTLAAEALVMTSAGGLIPAIDGAGGGCACGRRGRGGLWLRRCGQLRHGRNEHRRVPDP